jgi:4-hydroxy-2-oxoheptanedioate aldolase
MKNAHSLLRRVQTKQTVLGAWMFFREPVIAGTASKIGYDFVCIDMQHGLQSFDNMTNMINAVHLGDALPIVRVASPDEGLAGRYLDAGAAAIIFPMINTREQAESCVRACLYPPKGARSMGPIGSSLLFGDDYFDFANVITCVIPMIETREAVENLDDILSVDGVNIVFVGPSDLAISYGLPPANDNPNPEYQAALARIVERCLAHNVIAGVYSSAALARNRIEQGFRLLSITTDWDSAIGGITADLDNVRG